MKSASLELYRTFWIIGKTKNLTRAAERLSITQPGVSLALKALESQLDTVLCIRSKKGITLTREGQVLFEELDKAFTSIETAERKLEKLVNLESGSIAISASDTICNYFLLPFITRFTATYPQIRLEITNRTSMETAELLKAGQVDLGFVNLPFVDEALAVSSCSSITDVLVAGEKYKDLSKEKLPARDLHRVPLIMLERKSNSRLYLDQVFAEQGVTLIPVMELGSIDLMINFAKNNLGLAFIPEELCGQYADGETLFRVELDIPIPPRALGLVELKGSPLSFAAQHFKNLVLGYTE